MPNNPLDVFLHTHQLSAQYLTQAEKHFQAIVDDVLTQLKIKSPIMIGINGCQGSGKSTLAAYLYAKLQSEHQLCVANLSLDDFYLTKAERHNLSQKVHPLLSTRGVPGTHDMTLLETVLEKLLTSKEGFLSLPRFDKSMDDRKPAGAWEKQQLPVDVIIVEGWCLGATPQEESETWREPVNALEREKDKAGLWRTYVNQQLRSLYPKLFAKVDLWTMLKAPSFDSVFSWRLEQEQKLAKNLQASYQDDLPNNLMNASDIASFVQHFQRLTEHMLQDMPHWVDHIYILDENRSIIDEQHQHNQTCNPFRV